MADLRSEGVVYFFAAGLSKQLTFEAIEGPINDLIDDVYRAKYRGSQYLEPMIGGHARSATIKIMPRDANSSKSTNGTELKPGNRTS